MKYALDINIICTDAVTLDAVEAELPDVLDATVWDGEYRAPYRGVTEEEETTLSCGVRFHNAAGRDAIEEAVIALTGVLSGCEPGTYIRLHDCNHDGTGACLVSLIYEVV